MKPIMDPLQPVLGSQFFTHLHQPVLIIGKDSWDRKSLATEIGVTNTVSAGMLTKIATDLKAKSLTDLYNRSSPYTFADAAYRAGVTCLYVFFSACRARGLDIQDWYKLGENRAVTTFTQFKKREQSATAKTMTAPRAKADKRNRQGNFAKPAKAASKAPRLVKKQPEPQTATP